jgi:anti-anti-sigma regulatory factor
MDFQRLGPSIYRSIETYFLGYKKLKNSLNPQLQSKARWFAIEIRKAYPVFLAGRILGPNRTVRKWIAQLEKEIYVSLGKPSLKERILSLGALAAAVWTGIKLKLNIFQHPSLVRHVYRWPEEAPKLARAWRRLSELGLPLSVELRQENTIWVRLEHLINESDAKKLVFHLREVLQKKRERLVVDLEKVVHMNQDTARHIASNLEEFRHRVKLIIPRTFAHPEVAAFLAVFGHEKPGINLEPFSPARFSS